ncbi:MAG: DUF2281 domain-containing protein [Deltaproteobacteria bacterium]|nr:DUF2281 domain-containing protein [Deltaproteobacteria bacterium]
MNLADKIIKNIRELPESKQMEVLDFVEYLKIKTERQENIEWSMLSLSTAMRGMEDEQSHYSLNDLEESFS